MSRARQPRPTSLYALIVYDDDGSPLVGATSPYLMTLDEYPAELLGATRAEIVLFASLGDAVKWSKRRVDSQLMTAPGALSLLSVLAFRFE